METKIIYQAAVLFLAFTSHIPSSTCEYIPKWSCDFENGLCHWLQMTEDQVDFKHGKGSDVGWKDHTKKTGDGKLLYLDLAFSHPGYSQDNNAKLMSPVLLPNNGTCKMVLHYKIAPLIASDNIFAFVNLVTQDTVGNFYRKVLFKSFGESPWARKEISLQSSSSFQVEVGGAIPFHTFGKIGIDDILFSEGCQTTEKSPIKLVQLQSSPDHNYPAGIFYENLNSSWSPICSQEQARSACRLLGLQDVIANNSMTSVGTLKSGESFCLPSHLTVPSTKTCSSTAGCANVTFWECKQEYTSICPKLTHTQCTSAVATPTCVNLDQICDFVNNCPGGEDESNCLAYSRCDFQTDMCDWTAMKHSLLQWRRHRDGDSGRYHLKVDNSRFPFAADTGSLRLKYKIKGMSNSTCSLRFKYQIPRNHKGSLKVVIKGNRTMQTLWSKSSTSKEWFNAVVRLPHNKDIRVFFNATSTRTDGTFQIMLANITFSKHCRFTNHSRILEHNRTDLFLCHSGDVADIASVCDYKADCFDASDELNCADMKGRCDFDSPRCDWEIGRNAPEQLIRWRGRTPTRSTGPSKDHTSKFKSGYYVFLEGSWVAEGSFGYLISKKMQRSKTNKCTVRWFYNMHSSHSHDVGKLRVIYKDVSNQHERILWQIQGNQGRYWKFGSVTFDITSFLYQIKIEVERGTTHQSDIAIDDVSFASTCLHTDHYDPMNISSSGNCSSIYSITEDGASVSVSAKINGLTRRPCQLTLRSDPRLRINIFAEHFYSDLYTQINAGGNGSLDYGGRYPGSLVPFSLVSPTNSVTIALPRSFNASRIDFNISLTATDGPAHPVVFYKPSGPMRIAFTRACSGETARQVYSSPAKVQPRLAGTNYYNSERCIFKFYSFNGYRIKFSFTYFDTEDKFDYVEFLDNCTIGQRIFTGKLNPFSFVSRKSVVEFLFYSDSAVTRKGFVLYVSATSDVASVATTTVRKTVPTMTPHLSTTVVPFFKMNCHPKGHKSKIVNGDSIYGVITLVSSCTLWFNSPVGGDYILEFADLNTGSSRNTLMVSDSSGQSIKVAGFSSEKDKDLLRVHNRFMIQLHAKEWSSPHIKIRYSTYPGCYHISLRDFYKEKGYVQKSCRLVCKGFKYAFEVRQKCFCGSRPPQYFSSTLQHRDNCSCTDYIMPCSFGKLYMPVQAGENGNVSSVTSNTVTIASVLVSSAVLIVLGACAIEFYRRRKMKAQRELSGRRMPAAVTPANEGQSTREPTVHFSNGERLPSYQSPSKEGLFFYNTAYDHQSGSPSIINAPPSYAEVLAECQHPGPPAYESRNNSERHLDQRAGASATNPSHEFDLVVDLAPIEVTHQNESPSYLERRTSPRDTTHTYHSTASLRSNSAASLRALSTVQPANRLNENSEDPAVNSAERGMAQGEGGRALQERGRSQGELRSSMDNEDTRRSGNLPPLQRTRAYDSRNAEDEN